MTTTERRLHMTIAPEVNPAAKEAKLFDKSGNSIAPSEPIYIMPLLGTGGWPTAVTQDEVRYNFDSALTQAHNTPCYVRQERP
jgi:hypothetical protein